MEKLHALLACCGGILPVTGGFPSLKGFPDNKVYGANMGPVWGKQNPGGPHVGPMNFAI